MSILSGGVPTGYRHTGERALTAIDIRWLHSAANDGRPISRMSCYASVLSIGLHGADEKIFRLNIISNMCITFTYRVYLS